MTEEEMCEERKSETDLSKNAMGCFFMLLTSFWWHRKDIIGVGIQRSEKENIIEKAYLESKQFI